MPQATISVSQERGRWFADVFGPDGDHLYNQTGSGHGSRDQAIAWARAYCRDNGIDCIVDPD